MTLEQAAALLGLTTDLIEAVKMLIGAVAGSVVAMTWRG